ncbi:MAG: shikimate kinase [Acidobacteriota bacterium]
MTSDRNAPPAVIFLVGFMASGKTTVGPLLAEKLQRPFIDLDRVIERNVGCSIAELIARSGEEYFRRLETETLREAASGPPAVIAPGGGAITRVENRALMAAHGLTIWLDAPFEVCWQRIQQDGATRPLAADESSARQRYQQRLPLYQQANLHLPVSEKTTPDTLAETCLALLSGY